MSTYRTVEVTASFSGLPMNADAKLTDQIIESQGEPMHRVSFNAESNYNLLTNQPQIEDVTLIGNKTFEELGLSAATMLEVEAILQS